MANEVIVRIIAQRIVNKGENPLKQRPFVIDDIVNIEYRKAVEDYIILHSSALETAQ